MRLNLRCTDHLETKTIRYLSNLFPNKPWKKVVILCLSREGGGGGGGVIIKVYCVITKW